MIKSYLVKTRHSTPLGGSRYMDDLYTPIYSEVILLLLLAFFEREPQYIFRIFY